MSSSHSSNRSDPEASAAPRPLVRAWHGPRILLAAFVSFLVSTGFIFSIFGVLIGDVAESFGASMAVMGLMPSIYHVMSSFVSPFLGRHLGGIGIRRTMLVGACLMPTGLFAVSRADSIETAALCFAGLAVLGSIAMGPLSANTLITNWYGPSRGRSMGLASTGTTLAGTVLPPLAAYLIGLLGWRDALASLALLSAAVSLPTFWLAAVDRPADLGQLPEGGDGRIEVSPSSQALEPREIPRPTPTRTLIRNRDFWLIALTFGLLFSVSLVFATYMVLYGIEIGMTLQQAAWVMMGRSITSSVGQLGLARLSDRIGRRKVLAGVIAGLGVLWLILARTPSLPGFVAAGVGFGFFAGALAPLRGSMVAAVFGRSDFSKVTGLMVPAAMPVQIAAVPLAGLLIDRTQDYGDAFGTFLFVFPLAAVMLYFIRDRHGGESASG